MTDTQDIVAYLETLKEQYDVESDEYADISQTIHYVQQQ